MKRRFIKEINVIRKPKSSIQYRIALIYPNSYTIGMSGLTIKLLYHLLNKHVNVFTERIFYSPKDPKPPQSIETGTTLQNFDILAFTFQFELDYINAVRILQKSHIPPVKKNRKTIKPIIIAGGPAVTANPEIMKEIFDFFFLGEIESVVDQFLDTLQNSKNRDMHDLIEETSGFYCSSSNLSKAKPVLTQNLDEVPFPTAQVRPIEIRKKKGSLGGYFLQVTRGCPHTCHFCLIGRIYRPLRERSLSVLQDIIDKGKIESQTEFFSLIGSATADYSQIRNLLQYFIDNKLKFTLPSLRLDKGIELLDIVQESGQKTLSIAPEAGNENIRFKINKKITDNQIYDFVSSAKQYGIRQLKLYFILGLSSQPDTEANDIVKLLNTLEKQTPNLTYEISVNPLIPKCKTRLAKQNVDYSQINKAFKFLKNEIRTPVKYKSFSIEWAAAQAILSIGGSELTPKILSIAEKGGSLQAWKKTLGCAPTIYFEEHFNNI
ncbi:MAG: radical SAM protein [Candidatus Hodarchaeales archaeon]